MFFHCATETASPNHWWAFSCTITDVFAPLRKKADEYVGRVWVSSAYPITPGGATVPPRASNGYGPKIVLSQSVISAVRSTLAFAASRKSGVSSCEYEL